jgi:hypothetical protein
MKPKQLTIKSIGTPDFKLAAELFVPLLLDLHDKTNNPMRVLSEKQQGQIGHLDRCSTSGASSTGEI